MERLSIFDLLYDNFKIKNKVRLIECFAGYGSQSLALKYLGVNYEHYKICEWAVNSIIAYASLHRNELPNYGKDMCKELKKEEIAEKLFNMGVSLDYNKPAKLEQLKRISEEKIRLCYNSALWSNNLVDISKVKGKDLNIVDVKTFTYLLTYSFPCQDLSLAGKRKGMEKGTGTRSGLLWEVERILFECENKPQILVMENVTQVHGAGNNEHFKQWMLRLEELGYQSYWDDLIATDFQIPQTRNRTFMVSILGNYNYTFSKPSKLKLRLENLLEPESVVDKKFNISDKMLNGMLKTSFDSYKIENKLLDRNGVAATIIARFEGAPQLIKRKTLRIKNATKKGYLEANVGDGIDISSRMESHRGTVQKGKAQTLTTMGGENVGVVVKVPSTDIEKSITLGYYTPSKHESSRIVSSSSYPTVKENHGTIPAVAINEENISIRKLTPRECFRLMGLKDADINLIMENQTQASCYHLAGDSIVTTVLMAIFSKFYDIEWLEHFNPKEWWQIN